MRWYVIDPSQGYAWRVQLTPVRAPFRQMPTDADRCSRAREPAIAPSPPAHPLREAQEQKHGGAYYMYVAS